MDYFYIASPYNGAPQEMTERFEAAARVNAFLLRADIPVFSPLVHNHTLLPFFQDLTASQRLDMIMKLDLALLKNAKGMIVLTLPGWDRSVGVQQEIEYCKAHHIPIFYYSYEELENDQLVHHTLRTFITSLETSTQN